MSPDFMTSNFFLQTGDGRVSLQEFRELANSKGDLTLEGMPDC